MNGMTAARAVRAKSDEDLHLRRDFELRLARRGTVALRAEAKWIVAAIDEELKRRKGFVRRLF